MADAVIPWAQIEQALRQWVVDSTEIPDGRVIWGWPSHPQPPMPFAWLQVTTGLGHVGSPETVRASQTMRDRITVTAANEGPYTARIYEATPADETGVPYTYDAGPDDDIEQVRDGWASVLDGSPYTVTVEDDAILVEGTEEHPHFHLVVEEGAATRETEI